MECDKNDAPLIVFGVLYIAMFIFILVLIAIHFKNKKKHEDFRNSKDLKIIKEFKEAIVKQARKASASNSLDMKSETGSRSHQEEIYS